MALDPVQLERTWYGGKPPGLTLRLLSVVYRFAAMVHQSLGRIMSTHPGVPVIVVGNVTVGGTGKTPLVALLVSWLKEAGYRPGIISRGYRSSAGAGPVFVNDGSSAKDVGDEPLMLRRQTDVPVAVGSRRPAVARAMVKRHQVDVIISDDGLQHRRLGRDLEIAVVDGTRGLGNGMMLPAGPMREPASRLKNVDFVVSNGSGYGDLVMDLEPQSARNLVTGALQNLEEFADKPVIALAAIGRPERFFEMLEKLGLNLERKTFPDHHAFTARDLAGWADRTVLVTEKDAVKLSGLAGSTWWAVPVSPSLPESFREDFLHRVRMMNP